MILNCFVKQKMKFVKTSQKFGQWVDSQAATVYGIGCKSEAELSKVWLFDSWLAIPTLNYYFWLSVTVCRQVWWSERTRWLSCGQSTVRCPLLGECLIMRDAYEAWVLNMYTNKYLLLLIILLVMILEISIARKIRICNFKYHSKQHWQTC